MSQIIVCFSEIFRGYVMFNSLKYFLELNLSINMPSFEHIPEIVLKEDYKKISDEELLNFVERNKQRLEFLLKGVEEDNLLIELKKHYMLFEFNELIPKIRLNALKTNKPYDLDDLKGLEVDNDGLVDIHDYLNYKSENQYMLCSPLRDIDSNYWLWKEICKLKNDEKIYFKIRLDPLAINPVGFIYKMTVFGEPLDWDKLSDINDISKVQFFDNDIFTELYWKKRENKLHFVCEELPKYEEIEYMPSRYFHAIYNINEKTIVHCDGSIKIYDEKDFLNRNSIPLWDENSKNYGKYIKIFRADGEISTDKFTSLITSFFVRNTDISNYFKSLTKE